MRPFRDRNSRWKECCGNKLWSWKMVSKSRKRDKFDVKWLLYKYEFKTVSRSKLAMEEGPKRWTCVIDLMCTHWKKMLKSSKVGEYDRKWLLHNWSQLKPNDLRQFTGWNLQLGARETNSGHWPRVYVLKDAQISERRQVRSKMISAELSSIETQMIETIFTAKFSMEEGEAELRKSPHCISR